MKLIRSNFWIGHKSNSIIFSKNETISTYWNENGLRLIKDKERSNKCWTNSIENYSDLPLQSSNMKRSVSEEKKYITDYISPKDKQKFKWNKSYFGSSFNQNWGNVYDLKQLKIPNNIKISIDTSKVCKYQPRGRSISKDLKNKSI